MAIYLLAVVVSFILNAFLIVPYINFLYRLKFQRASQKTKDAFNRPTPIFDQFHKHKTGTPVGGGILVILTTVITYAITLIFFFIFNKKILTNYPSLYSEIKIILFTFISFAFLGLFDDLNKIFFLKDKQFFGLRLMHKLVIEIFLAFIIAFWLYQELKINIIGL